MRVSHPAAVQAPFRWITVASFQQDASADLAKSLLDEAEVPCFLKKDKTLRVFEALCPRSRAQLCVPDDHVERAEQALRPTLVEPAPCCEHVAPIASGRTRLAQAMAVMILAALLIALHPGLLALWIAVKVLLVVR